MTDAPPNTEGPANDGADLSCTLESEQLAAFLDGCLSPEAAAAVEEHLVRCEACRWVAATSAGDTAGRRRPR